MGIALFACLGMSTPAVAHAVGSETGHLKPRVGVLMLVSVSGYARGLHNRWRAATRRAAIYSDAIAFGAGIGSMALVLGGQVEQWTETSFAAHMFQHEILMLVTAPLLVLGRPLATWAWAFTAGRRRGLRLFYGRANLGSLWRVLTGVTGATLLQLIVIWGWHVPRFFDLATRVPVAHAMQHASFLLSALCFWWATTRDARVRTLGITIVALFVTMVATSGLGALLTFAPSVWFAPYVDAHSPFGLSALEEQQLG